MKKIKFILAEVSVSNVAGIHNFILFKHMTILDSIIAENWDSGMNTMQLGTIDGEHTGAISFG